MSPALTPSCTSPALDTPDHAGVRKCFEIPKSKPVVPDERTVDRLAYLVGLLRGHPKQITHGQAHKDLRNAVRILLRVLPNIIQDAATEALAAEQDGRTTDMGHLVWRARALLDAAQPFESVSSNGQRDHRGWWHGWARLIADEVRSVLRQHGQTDGVKNPKSPAIVITQALLAVGNVHPEAHGVIHALKDGD